VATGVKQCSPKIIKGAKKTSSETKGHPDEPPRKIGQKLLEGCPGSKGSAKNQEMPKSQEGKGGRNRKGEPRRTEKNALGEITKSVF